MLICTPSSADQLADSPAPWLPEGYSTVNELFALLVYGIVAAFYRLTGEARLVPDLRVRISLVSIVAAEIGYYALLHDALERRGVDVVSAMSKYVSALENSHHWLTKPNTWLEALVQAYVGDSLAFDLYYGDRLVDCLVQSADTARLVLLETTY